MFPCKPAATSIATRLIPVLLAAAAPAPAQADDGDRSDPLIEELFRTESVYPQERGETQLTMALGYSQNSPEGDGRLAEFGIEYGITDRLQIEAGVPLWQDRELLEEDAPASHSGVGDLEFGVKYSMPAGNGVAVAVGIEFTAPTGDPAKGLGEDAWIYEPFVIFGKRIGEVSEITLALAYGIADGSAPAGDSDDQESGDEIEVGFGVVRAFGPAWRGSLELSYESEDPGGSFSDSETFAIPGVIYKGLDDMEIALGVALGLTDDSPDRILLASFNLEF